MENYSTSTFKFEIPKVSVLYFIGLSILLTVFILNYSSIEKLVLSIMSFNDKINNSNYYLELKLTKLASIKLLLVNTIICLFFLMLRPLRLKYPSYFFKTKNRFILYLIYLIISFTILISSVLISYFILGFGFMAGLCFGAIVGLMFILFQTISVSLKK